jgi:hypothetical protein
MPILKTSSPAPGISTSLPSHFKASRHPLAMALALVTVVLGTVACPGTPAPSTPDAGQQRPDSGTKVDAGAPDSGIVDPEPDAGVEPPPPPAFTLQASPELSLRRVSSRSTSG